MIYQHFYSLGFEAKNVCFNGIRALHNIDVSVKSEFLGTERVFWVSEKGFKKELLMQHKKVY